MQRPDANCLSGELKANLDCRIAAGRMDSTPSGMVLDSPAAADLPKIKGRGMIRVGGELTVYQGYYVDLGDKFDALIAAGPAGGAPTSDDTPTAPQSVEVPADAGSGSTNAQPQSSRKRSKAVASAGTVSSNGDGTVSREHAAEPPEVTQPTVKFSDVGGYADVKTLIRDAVGTLITDADAASEYRLRPSGVPLHGAPGTGKSYLAEATAGEFDLSFCKVSTADMTSAIVGGGPEAIKAAVDAAIAAAPCLLLIDELDGIAPRRDQGGLHGEDRKGVTELLRQLDRARDAEGVVVMATTNDLESLDAAVIRDGRMDHRIRIDLPDADAREAILRASLDGRKAAEAMDLGPVVEVTKGSSGATLAAIVDAAATRALHDARRPITVADLLAAIEARGDKDRPTVEGNRMADLVLLPETRRELVRLIGTVKDPARATALGIEPPKGLVLYGPPGTGKTSIARAIAAEASTSLYAISGADLRSGRYRGDDERRVKDLFARARSNAPAVIFIDEIDAIGGQRSSGGDGASAADVSVLNAVLSELDGFSDLGRVFVIGATNRVEVLDQALLRHGRLSRQIEVGLPDHAGRIELLRRAAKRMPIAGDVSMEKLAWKLADRSPADLIGVLEGAAHHALDRLGDATDVPVVITAEESRPRSGRRRRSSPRCRCRPSTWLSRRWQRRCRRHRTRTWWTRRSSTTLTTATGWRSSTTARPTSTRTCGARRGRGSTSTTATTPPRPRRGRPGTGVVVALKDDLAALRREYEGRGWTVRRTAGGHLRWTPPRGRGGVVHTPTTPSDRRGLLNARAELRRVERAHATRHCTRNR